MSDVPARDVLTQLVAAAREFLPALTMGLARRDETRAHVVYSHANGVGQFVLAPSELPHVLCPADTVQEGAAAAMSATPAGAVDWLMALGGVQRVVSAGVGGHESQTRLWVGLSDSTPLTPAQRERFERLARTSAEYLNAPPTAADLAERLRRLELAAGLMPALLHVLDVREVFDRLSQIASAALAHDLLLLRLFSEDGTKITVYAHSARGTQVRDAAPQPYPPAVTRAWEFDIVDDLSVHPLERDQPPAKLFGARSALRLPVRFDDRVIGGLGIFSLTPGRFGTEDVSVARRLADQVAVGLSHHRLAEQGRRAAALQERTTNLEMLEGLLHTLAGVLDIRDVFDRVSVIADKVLPHDGMSIVENIDDYTRIRFHATHGLGDLPQPFDLPTPDPALVAADWDYRLIDDLREVPSFSRSPALAAGMRSMILVALRVGGVLFGGLNFYAKAPGRYTNDDVLIARRISDHVALALSHRQLAEQARRHEDLRARSEKSELLDDLVAVLVSSGELSSVFDRVSAVARKVLPHDALFLTVLSADGARARRYVSTGVDTAALPDEIEIPEAQRHMDWDYQLAEDLTVQAQTDASPLLKQGFRSALQMPIRLDGRMVGGLAFLSKARGAFSQDDVAVARRVVDRVALSLSRERGLEASRRADEASERAARLEARVRALTEELDARTGYRRVVGESRQWRHVLTQATQVAATEATVLLLGESGTGKEVVARFLHRASGRKNGPFVALNCAALPEQLLEAELFGYERGAFTGATQSKPGQLEQASGGTLFLDEVGEMSLPAQAKFLRVLQEREFQRLGGTRVLRTDARIVAATNRDLQKAIGNAQFREDLYYRLNVFAITLPALRERRDDVLPLSEAFLSEIGRGLGRPPGGIAREARQLLIDYHWPGNVRELRNILERAAILCDGGLITSEHLAISVPVTPAVSVVPSLPASELAVAAPVPPSGSGDLHSMERAMIEQALQTARFNKSKAAKALGLTRHQLYIRMRKYGFE